MTSSLVGSEMCIRDSFWWCQVSRLIASDPGVDERHSLSEPLEYLAVYDSVSYTHLTLPTICSV
eukprot:9209434-Prorocentrum_lima.AAC.1